MKNVLKSLILLLTAAVLVLSSTGCSSGSKGDNGAVTITWWLGGDQPEDFDEALKVMNDYTAEKIGVKLDLKLASSGDYSEKVNMVINSGEYFDMMWTDVTNYKKYAQMGAFADITDKVKTVSEQLYNFIPQNLWDGVLVDGKIYSVPTYKDSSATFYVCWDKALIDKYGIDYKNVDTIEEVSDWMYKINKDTGKNVWTCSGYSRGASNWFYKDYSTLVSGLGYVIGVGMFDESLKVVPVLEQETPMNALKIYHQWYKDGIINQDAPTLSSMPSKTNILCAQGFPGAESIWAGTLGCKETVITPICDPFYDTGTIQGSLNAISSGSKYADKCLKYLELLNTDTYLRNMMAYGIRGKDWEYVEGDSGTVTKLSDNWTLPAFYQATFFNMSPLDTDPANKYDLIKGMNEQAKSSVVCGFALDKTNIETQIANCRAIYDKYWTELACGASDPEKIVPQMYDEMYQVGLQDIIDETQKQVNKFGGK
ncbi:ABC transporter substrate-binding protein [Anaerocolumna sp. MB42-C2]|uniref:ABC transporter substrate-binding protein n=1 Tax=Anaerocolumna sp. MB42-C2 TaxID=3070997 RepID=UPI0027E00719|nr:ABC transporter substrate-binding protein [Anaerocolumna sp. MB42-C2]WMJ87834.1 ABC transporter substrate-binding protein [Anaerocolumna sp. MB42-C2]